MNRNWNSPPKHSDEDPLIPNVFSLNGKPFESERLKVVSQPSQQSSILSQMYLKKDSHGKRGVEARESSSNPKLVPMYQSERNDCSRKIASEESSQIDLLKSINNDLRTQVAQLKRMVEAQQIVIQKKDQMIKKLCKVQEMTLEDQDQGSDCDASVNADSGALEHAFGGESDSKRQSPNIFNQITLIDKKLFE